MQVSKVCVSLHQQTKRIMKNQTLNDKVAAQLIKWGNNPIEVSKMVSEHFEYASKNYSSVKTIAECIRTIY